MKSIIRMLLPLGMVLCGLCTSVGATDFPRWRGENSNGSAGETAMPLITSWNDVRVAWVSEVKSPQPWNYSVVRGRTQWPRSVLCNGGMAEPTIFDGKVYINFFRPSGTELKPVDTDKWQASGLPGYTLLHADEVITCMDAATGRTIWETVWEGTEANLIEAYGEHINMCIADGRVYAFGVTGLIYCADAKTGEKLWVASVPSHNNWAKYNGKALAEIANTPPLMDPPHPEGGSLDRETYNSCLVVADGVVVAGEWSRADCLFGFDAKTSKELWRNAQASGGLVPPLRWLHEGKEYLITTGNTIHCLEPKTGKILWTSGVVDRGPYDAATGAIDGDLLVVHGQPPAGSPKGIQSWACYQLSLKGAEKVWSVDTKYGSAGYVAPVIHRGYAWLPGNGAKGGVFVCADMKTGKVVSEIAGFLLEATCPGPLAMGDLLIHGRGEGITLINIADPKAPKLIGFMVQPASLCTSSTAADGFIYSRGAERVVTCLDVRTPASRTSPAKHDDMATALLTIQLENALKLGKSPTVFLRAKDGGFPQAWATVPDTKYPDVFDTQKLKIAGNVLSGQAKLMTAGTFYDYKINATLNDGMITGDYEGSYPGVPLENTVSGTMLAAAGKNCVLKLTWTRNWFNGSGQVHEHNMFVTVADGKVTKVELIPRRGIALNNQYFNPTIEQYDLKYDGVKFTGSLTLDMKCSGATPGHYTWNFDVAPLNNLMRGTIDVIHEGVHKGTYECYGDATVPATEPVTLANSVVWIDLKESVRYENDTAGYTDTRIYATIKEGKGVTGSAIVRSSGGMQRADVSGLHVEGNHLKGPVEVWMKGDGYVIRTEAYSIYNIDVVIDGTTINGEYTGTFDKRENVKGKISGTYAND